jgi:predicted transcriptional regulator
MTATSERSLPVLEDNRVIGMVSRSDIVHVLARGDADIHDDVITALRRAGLSCVVEISDGIASIARLDDPHTAPAVCNVATGVPGVVAVQIFT